MAAAEAASSAATAADQTDAAVVAAVPQEQRAPPQPPQTLPARDVSMVDADQDATGSDVVHPRLVAPRALKGISHGTLYFLDDPPEHGFEYKNTDNKPVNYESITCMMSEWMLSLAARVSFKGSQRIPKANSE